MEHSFDIYHAQKYGVNEAILIKNFAFWIGINKANRRHKHDGRTWTYNSMEAFTIIFPYLSLKQIRRVLNKLLREGVLIKGCYNEELRDRTSWYAFIDEKTFLQKGTMQMPIRANANDHKGNSLYTDNKHTDTIKGEKENIDNYLIDLNNKATAGGSAIVNTDRTITIIDNPLKETEEIKKKKNTRKKRKEYTPEFEQFWQNYKDKEGSKRTAFNSWLKLDEDEQRKATNEASNYNEWIKATCKYKKHASTWLNNECWETELIFPVTQTQSNNGSIKSINDIKDGSLIAAYRAQRDAS